MPLTPDLSPDPKPFCVPDIYHHQPRTSLRTQSHSWRVWENSDIYHNNKLGLTLDKTAGAKVRKGMSVARKPLSRRFG